LVPLLAGGLVGLAAKPRVVGDEVIPTIGPPQLRSRVSLDELDPLLQPCMLCELARA
jgi:hypothetical protein